MKKLNAIIRCNLLRITLTALLSIFIVWDSSGQNCNATPIPGCVEVITLNPTNSTLIATGTSNSVTTNDNFDYVGATGSPQPPNCNQGFINGYDQLGGASGANIILNTPYEISPGKTEFEYCFYLFNDIPNATGAYLPTGTFTIVYNNTSVATTYNTDVSVLDSGMWQYICMPITVPAGATQIIQIDHQIEHNTSGVCEGAFNPTSCEVFALAPDAIVICCDIEPPVINASDAFFSCTDTNVDAQIQALVDGVTVSDNCVMSPTFNVALTNTVTNDCDIVYTYEVIADPDECDNDANETFTVTVENDDLSPTGSIPPVDLLCDDIVPQQATNAVDFVVQSGILNDVCAQLNDISLISANDDLTMDDIDFCTGGTITRTYVFEDLCENQVTIDQQFNYLGAPDLIIGCPPNNIQAGTFTGPGNEADFLTAYPPLVNAPATGVNNIQNFLNGGGSINALSCYVTNITSNDTFTCLPNKTTQVNRVYTATNNCGQTASCTQYFIYVNCEVNGGQF